MTKAKNLQWGSANRPKISNKLGIPHSTEGSDGDIQIRQTNLGAKLFGKIGGRWSSTFLSNEEEVMGTSGTKIGMDSSGTLTVQELQCVGKLKIGKLDGTFNTSDNINIGNAQSGIGLQNVCIGYQAGEDLDENSTVNVLVGYQAGMNITGFTGTGNVCIGGSAGNAVTNQNNVCIGNGSDSTTTFGVAIGQNVTTTGSYGIAIGNAISSAADTITVGRASAGNYWSMDFTSSTTWAHSSDSRMKRNIQDDTLGLSFINDLSTKTFQWKPSEEFPEEWENYTLDKDDNKVYPEMHDRVMHGMIAQDVKIALDNAGISTFEAWKENEKGIQQLAPASFVYPLIKAVQELSAKVDAMQVEINNLK